jgi:hypothetical protein
MIKDLFELLKVDDPKVYRDYVSMAKKHRENEKERDEKHG